MASRELTDDEVAAMIAPLFDHLVGARKQRRRYFETKHLGNLEIDYQLVLGRRLYRRSNDEQYGQGTHVRDKALGFLLGMHALEADHVAAVASIAARRTDGGDIVREAAR